MLSRRSLAGFALAAVAPLGPWWGCDPRPVPEPTTTVAPSTTVTPSSTSTTVEPSTTVAPTTTTRPPGGVQFVETFDTPASLDRFDFAVHHAWNANATDAAWPGDHDEACGGADTQRRIDNPTRVGTTYYPGLVAPTSYWCREHLMTSFNTNHYAQVDFAPKATFTDVTRVCWTQSRTDMGSRHWTQLAVVPADTFDRNGGRLDYVASRFSPSGPGKYGLHPTDETLLVEFGRGVPRVQVGQTVYDSNGLAWNAGNDRMTRYRTCVIDTGSGVRVELERPGGVDVYTRGGGIPDGPVRVILQQDLYNPDKAPGAPNAYSVHWDDLTVE